MGEAFRGWGVAWPSFSSRSVAIIRRSFPRGKPFLSSIYAAFDFERIFPANDLLSGFSSESNTLHVGLSSKPVWAPIRRSC